MIAFFELVPSLLVQTGLGNLPSQSKCLEERDCLGVDKSALFLLDYISTLSITDQASYVSLL